MIATMASSNASPKHSASLDGLKEKSNTTTGPVAVEGQIVAPNLEYERYLELHNQFEGPAKKKFMRKCKSEMSAA